MYLINWQLLCFDDIESAVQTVITFRLEVQENIGTFVHNDITFCDNASDLKNSVSIFNC